MALPLPPEIKYGRIRGRFLRSRSDTASDTDELPDGEPLQGTITLSPFLYRQVTQLPKPATILHDPQVFELNSGGYLVDPNSVDGAWVPTGIYEVSYSLVGGIIRNHVVEVTTAHTEIAPLDLSNAKPPDGTPLQPSQYAELDARLQVLEGTAAPTDHTHPDLIAADAALSSRVTALENAPVVPDLSAPLAALATRVTALENAGFARYITLGPEDPVPTGTAEGTLIFRKEA